MMRFLIFINALLWTGNSIGQINNLAKIPQQPPTKKEAEIEDRNHNCAKQRNNSFSTRLKNYPFNLSAEIQLVSFLGSMDTVANEIVYRNDSLPRLNDTVCFSKLYEVKTLTFTEVDRLTDIFYNYGFLGKVHIMSMDMCYNPRNAILFKDKNGKVFELIEICFECKRVRESSENISLGQMCDQKLDMIKEVFKKAGIEYGVTKGFTTGN
jgi:hypothetical protein